MKAIHFATIVLAASLAGCAPDAGQADLAKANAELDKARLKTDADKARAREVKARAESDDGGSELLQLPPRTMDKAPLRCEPLSRARFIVVIGAAGILQPTDTVEVAARVQGTISHIGADPGNASKMIDWGSKVVGPQVDKDGKMVPGTLLARIDAAPYEARRDAARAALAQTEANVEAVMAAILAAEADNVIKETVAKKAAVDCKARVDAMAKGQPIRGPDSKLYKAITQAEVDQYQEALTTARNNFALSTAILNVARANRKAAESAVEVNKANLAAAQANLDCCDIRAPVAGVVIDRRVNLGQNVAVSPPVPSLFVIARDLTKMELWANVKEADVGRIMLKNINGTLIGPDVHYTFAALAGREFKGKLVPQGKLPYRVKASLTSDDVGYFVVVSVDNSNLMLTPYMTAKLAIVLENKENALLVANAALRWQPAQEHIAVEQRDRYFALNKKAVPPDERRGFIWVPRKDGLFEFIHVRLGTSDSARTEILSALDGGKVDERTRVVVGDEGER